MTNLFPKPGRGTRQSLVGAVLAVAFLVIPTPAHSEERSSGHAIVPPNATPLGMTYGEWSARFWQWAFMLPFDQGPYNWMNETNPDCSTGQLGPVWFLVGFSPGPTTITCQIPAGKALFFPIINNECSNLEEFPYEGQTAEARHRCAVRDTTGVPNPVELEADIDGKNIQNLSNYRAQSPDFDFVVPPPPNVLGLSTGAFGHSASDGYYLMVVLSTGQHTVHFKGEIRNPSVGDLKIDTTYKLNVQ